MFRKDGTVSLSPISTYASFLWSFFNFRSTSRPKYSNPITVQLGVVLGWISFSCALELSSPVTDQRRWIWLHNPSEKCFFGKRKRFSIMWSLSHQIQHHEVYIWKWHHKQLLKTYEITQRSFDSPHTHTNGKNARNDKTEHLNFT